MEAQKGIPRLRAGMPRDLRLKMGTSTGVGVSTSTRQRCWWVGRSLWAWGTEAWGLSKSREPRLRDSRVCGMMAGLLGRGLRREMASTDGLTISGGSM
ncbi:hypothetical protein CCMA1212_000819 [Trichoderma ghanense]|uniref:Uncharacterized protein n=1 Tax=Trichoderma ghanense TaxID=65468 RepID=A0ABY2HFG9_9HYPO